MIKKKQLIIMLFGAMLLLLFNNIASAEVHHIVAEGVYEMGDSDSRQDAANKALKEAKRIASEKAGTYIESYSEMHDKVVTKDEIVAVAAAVMQIVDQKTEFDTSGDKWVCHAVINADVDDSNIDIDAILADRRERDEDYQRMKRENEELKAQVDMGPVYVEVEVPAKHDPPPSVSPAAIGPKPFSFATASQIEGLIIDARQFHDYIVDNVIQSTNLVIGENGTIVCSRDYFKDKWDKATASNIAFKTNLLDIDCNTPHGVIDFTQMTIVPALYINGVDQSDPWGPYTHAIVIDSDIADALPPLDTYHCKVLY